MPAPKSPYQPYASVHQKTNGPGDARPTALQVVKDENAIGAHRGRVFLITGTSSGIGVETARALYETGATLYLSARQIPKLEKVVDDIVANGKLEGVPRPEILEMHLDSLDSVRKAAEEFKGRSDRLDVLICNAGVMAAPYSTTQDKLETQWGTNHAAHFLLFQLLKPLMLATAAKSGQDARVVTTSSVGHRYGGVRLDDINWEDGSYDKWKAYGQSKTSNIYMANAIDRRYGSKGLHATSAHPGGIMTELTRHTSPDDWARAGLDMEALAPVFKSPEQGAATQTWAAIAKHFDGHGGVYLEDVGEAGAATETAASIAPGYAGYAYDEEAEEGLWKLSCKVVGVEED
ncbi:hypothetical protein B0A48_17377 [Cryoendolithus antarcticus]|uniref:Oxidoreductase n=1 Tax=Cryoendolithus antarcticus TaxID=1507870 RepID=A0A1V8SCQ3_9PEZI|nr:hypothetical protein B0A48_17377 [Cryoendolithus antarcticus]